MKLWYSYFKGDKMIKVVLWILAILVFVGIAMLNPLIAAGIVIAGLLIPVVFEKVGMQVNLNEIS